MVANPSAGGGGLGRRGRHPVLHRRFRRSTREPSVRDTSEYTDCSSSTPIAFMNLLRKPIMTDAEDDPLGARRTEDVDELVALGGGQLARNAAERAGDGDRGQLTAGEVRVAADERLRHLVGRRTPPQRERARVRGAVRSTPPHGSTRTSPDRRSHPAPRPRPKIGAGRFKKFGTMTL